MSTSIATIHWLHIDFQSIESHHFLTTNPYTFKLIFLAPQGIIIHYYNHFFYSQILLPTTSRHYFLKKDISFELPDLLLPIPPMFLLLCLLFVWSCDLCTNLFFNLSAFWNDDESSYLQLRISSGFWVWESDVSPYHQGKVFFKSFHYGKFKTTPK